MVATAATVVILTTEDMADMVVTVTAVMVMAIIMATTSWHTTRISRL